MSDATILTWVACGMEKERWREVVRGACDSWYVLKERKVWAADEDGNWVSVRLFIASFLGLQIRFTWRSNKKARL